MKDIYNKNNFLGRWIDNALSNEEKEDFQKSSDYSIYMAILEGADKLKVPAYNKRKLYNELQSQKNAIRKKNIKKRNLWAISIAASLTILIGLSSLFNTQTKHSTKKGEQLAITLPDQSTVNLNNKSSIIYNKKSWSKSRNVHLNGEAFFNVKKGKKFIVKTNNGSVTVLGTKFSTNSYDSFFEIICYEGKVKVSYENFNKIIIKNEAISIIDGTIKPWKCTDTHPTWLVGESNFINTSLKHIIKTIENQYNVKIKYDNTNISRRSFTGSFPNNNLENALKIVFTPLEIKYHFSDSRTITLYQ
jgi:ferric-dicitrate binding protein FerR (iron transport regulator)